MEVWWILVTSQLSQLQICLSWDGPSIVVRGAPIGLWLSWQRSFPRRRITMVRFTAARLRRPDYDGRLRRPDYDGPITTARFTTARLRRPDLWRVARVTGGLSSGPLWPLASLLGLWPLTSPLGLWLGKLKGALRPPDRLMSWKLRRVIPSIYLLPRKGQAPPPKGSSWLAVELQPTNVIGQIALY